MAASLQVSRTRLAEALKVLGRRAAERKGQVLLTFTGHDLVLRAGRVEATIPATGTWSGEVRVAGNLFLNLWREMPEVDPVPLRVEQERLLVASLSLPCIGIEKPADSSPKNSDRDKKPAGEHIEQFWLEGLEPEESDQEDTEKRALDELFTLAQKYRSSKSYWELLQFIAKFRFYSPYNAMLVHIQMPGARFVASARRWQKEYHRNILPNAHPLVILRPGGPVMFVFDVSDTEATPYSTPFPSGIVDPFRAAGFIGSRLEMTTENAKKDGIQVLYRKEGSQSAGSIRPAPKGAGSLQISRHHPKSDTVDNVDIPIRYTVLINEGLNRELRYTTLVHELAHLYCGHLGTPNEKWWPDRTTMPKQTREFEAESVAYLVCVRLGITSPSEEYLAGYVSENGEVPEISMDYVMKAAGLIEQMSKKWLGLRKDRAE